MNPPLESGGWQSEKIQPHHRDRLAVVYVRQSTLQQVLDHQNRHVYNMDWRTEL
jgi:hypothetical protein